MPVSHLNNSVAEMWAAGLNTLTEGSFSHLTTGEDELLARLVSEMTGQSYSHLTTGRETLWELLLTQAAADEISFDRNNQSNEEIAAIIANGVTAPGGEYEGPLDIVSGAVVAYGQRALSAAMLGQPLYTIREDSGDTTQTFNADAETGDAPTASITTFLNGAGGFVSSWRDQSGDAKHLAQATSANQPAWLSSQQGGRPALSGGFMETSATSFPDGALTVFAVVKGPVETTTQNGAGYIDIMYGAGAYNDMFDGTNEAGGSYSGLVTDADYHLIDMAWQNGVNSYVVDGVEAAENNDYDSGAVGPLTLEVVLLLNGVGAYLAEKIVYSGILTAPQRLAIRQNMQAAYATPALP